MKYPSYALPGFVLSALLYCNAANTAAAAEETYVLGKKNHVPAVGTVLNKETSMDLKDATMTVNAGGQEIEGTMNRKQTVTEKVEALSPTKLRVTITAKDVQGKMVINGQEQPTPPEPEPLVNKPLLLELKEGKWTASLEDGSEPTPAQMKSLKSKSDSANNDADFEMYGDKPRKVGDEWKVDPAKTGFGDEAEMTGDYKVKFVEVKEVAGVKCAVLKATYDIKGKAGEGGGEQAMSMSLKGDAISTRSLADMQDMDVQITATMTMNGSPAEGVSMNVVGPMKGEQKLAIKKP